MKTIAGITTATSKQRFLVPRVCKTWKLELPRCLPMTKEDWGGGYCIVVNRQAAELHRIHLSLHLSERYNEMEAVIDLEAVHIVAGGPL